MKNILHIFLLLLVSYATPSLAHAQNIEYGQTTELKGITRIFIDTDTDMRNRERVVKELGKSKIPFEILSAPEGAQVILEFAATRNREVVRTRTLPPLSEGLPARTHVDYAEKEHGNGVVYLPQSSERRRILLSWSGEEGFTASSAAKFASAFVKAYKRANNLK
jgi:hypothetical protein